MPQFKNIESKGERHLRNQFQGKRNPVRTKASNKIKSKLQNIFKKRGKENKASENSGFTGV